MADCSDAINALVEAVEAVERELGITPSSVYANVRARLDVIEARINNPFAPSPDVENPFIIGNDGVTISVGDGYPTENRLPGSLFLRKDGYEGEGLYSRAADNIWYPVTPVAAVPRPTIAAGTQTASTGTVVFSNANGLTFGMSGSSAITASHNGISNIKVSAGTTSNNLSAITFSNSNGISFGINASTLTASHNGISNINVSAGTTSNNLSALTFSNSNGISFGLSGSTVTASVGLYSANDFYEPNPLLNAVTTSYAPVLGSFYIQPFLAPLGISGGRINVIKSFASSHSVMQMTSSSVFASNTTGSRGASYSYTNSAVMYSRGTGTNNTRLESFWSNTYTFALAQTISVATGGATTISVSNAATLSYLSINTAGAYTATSLTASGSTSTASSNMATSVNISSNSVWAAMTGLMIMPIGFNTSISAGNYWFAQAFSSSSSSAGTSGSIQSFISQVGISAPSQSIRLFGQTTTTSNSFYIPGGGAFSATSASPPSNIAFTDIRSFSTNVIQYFNFVGSNAT
jgi:hypothetical protein